MEGIWCGEFERLKALIARAGGSIKIDKALPVGAVPLKLIEEAGSEDASDVSVRGSRHIQRDR